MLNEEKNRNAKAYNRNVIVAVIFIVAGLFILGYVFSGIAYILFSRNYKLSLNNKTKRKLSIIGQTISSFFFFFSSAYHTQSMDIPLNERIISCSIVGLIFAVICFFILRSKDKKQIIDEADYVEEELVEEDYIEIEEETKSESKIIYKQKKEIRTKYCKNCGGKLDENKKCKKCGKQYFHIKPIKSKNVLLVIGLSVALVVSIGFNICQSNNEKDNTSEIKRLKEEIRDLEDNNSDLLMEKIDYKVKADFLDRNIVFVIKGYGDYAYSYDCMMEKVNGNFSFWAYNKDQALDRGFKIINCD